MDINRAKKIISALAEGVDPTTGELLPEDSVYNKGDIINGKILKIFISMLVFTSL